MPAALVAYHSCVDVLAGLRAHTAANVGPWGFRGACGGNVAVDPQAGGASPGGDKS